MNEFAGHSLFYSWKEGLQVSRDVLSLKNTKIWVVGFLINTVSDTLQKTTKSKLNLNVFFSFPPCTFAFFKDRHWPGLTKSN